MKNMLMKNKKWILIFSALLALSLAGAAALRYFGGGEIAVISVNGEVVKTVDLRANGAYEFTIDAENGSYNRIRVENGKIRVIEAGCHDKLCVNQGFAQGGIPVVCLPNKLQISVGGGKIDAGAGGM